MAYQVLHLLSEVGTPWQGTLWPGLMGGSRGGVPPSQVQWGYSRWGTPSQVQWGVLEMGTPSRGTPWSGLRVYLRWGTLPHLDLVWVPPPPPPGPDQGNPLPQVWTDRKHYLPSYYVRGR